MVWRLIGLLAVGTAVVLLLRWATAADHAQAALLRPADPVVVALGRETYVAQCASCHGGNLEGQADWRSPGPDGLLPAPPHDETGHTWHHDDETLFELTKYGLSKFAGKDYRSAMPAYEGALSDDEIIAVLSYIKSRWPEDIRERHDELNAQMRAR